MSKFVRGTYGIPYRDTERERENMIPVTSCEHETFKGKNHTMRVGMLPPHSMCVIYIEREYVG